MFVFWCAGCGCMHEIDTNRWGFNGDLVRPTVSPSILVYATKLDDDPRCHFFVKDGSIHYLRDSTHGLAGRTVAMTPPP